MTKPQKPTAKAQFARTETHAMFKSKTQPKDPPADWKAKSTVEGVCKEAARIEDNFSLHVEGEKIVDHIYGKFTPTEVYESVKKRYEEMKDAGERIRYDQGVLVSGVMSYPNSEPDADFYSWLMDTQQWLIDKYGDKLLSVVVHYDESHPHCHFFCADLETLSVIGLDPCKTARQAEEKKRKESQLIADEKIASDPRSEEEKEANPLKVEVYVPKMKAQKQALSAWLDDYHQSVSVKYDHQRDTGAVRARKHGTPRQVRTKLALEAQEKALLNQAEELAKREEELKEKTEKYLRMAKDLRVHMLNTYDKSKVYDGLIEQLNDEVTRLQNSGKAAEATALAGKINALRIKTPSKQPRATLS